MPPLPSHGPVAGSPSALWAPARRPSPVGPRPECRCRCPPPPPPPAATINEGKDRLKSWTLCDGCTINEVDPYVAVSWMCTSSPWAGLAVAHSSYSSTKSDYLCVSFAYVISCVALSCPCPNRGRATSIPSSSDIPCGRAAVGEEGGGGGGLGSPSLGDRRCEWDVW